MSAKKYDMNASGYSLLSLKNKQRFWNDYIAVVLGGIPKLLGHTELENKSFKHMVKETIKRNVEVSVKQNSM